MLNCEWAIPFIQYSFSSKMYPFINYSSYLNHFICNLSMSSSLFSKTFWYITYTTFILRWKCSILCQSNLAINPSIYTHKHTTHCKYIFVHVHLLFNEYYWAPTMSQELPLKLRIKQIPLSLWSLVSYVFLPSWSLQT